MTPSLEVAFEMIESTLCDGDTKIVGFYEAPVTQVQDQVTTLSQTVATQIRTHFTDAVILSV